MATLATVLFFCAADCLAADAPASSRPVKETYLRIADEVDANFRRRFSTSFSPPLWTSREAASMRITRWTRTRKAGDNKSIVYQGRLTWTAPRPRVSCQPRRRSTSP